MIVDVFLFPVPEFGPHDVVLRDPALLELPPVVVPTGSGGGAGGSGRLARGKPFRKKLEPQPVVVALSLMDDLVNRYGIVHGRQVYFAMERELKGPFAPGNKYDATQRPTQPLEVETPAARVAVIPPARRS